MKALTQDIARDHAGSLIMKLRGEVTAESDQEIAYGIGVAYRDSSGTLNSYRFYLGEIIDQNGSPTFPVSPDDNTIWEIGSSTKSFAATLLALQVEAGNVSSSDLVYPIVADYLPSGSAPSSLQSITLEQLASMTSGMAGQNHTGSGIGNIGKLPQYFAALLQSGNYPDSGYFDYSNSGYSLLAYAMMILEKYSSPPSSIPYDQFADFVLSYWQSSVLEPLGITSGQYYPPTSEYSFPLGYGNPPDGQKGNWPAHAPAGGLLLTTPDLLTWLQANMQATGPMTSSVLSFLQSDPVSTQQNQNPNSTFAEGQTITRGWFQNTYASQLDPGTTLTMVTKNGAVPSFKAGVSFIQPASPGADADFGVCIQTNDHTFTPVQFAQEFLDWMVYWSHN